MRFGPGRKKCDAFLYTNIVPFYQFAAAVYTTFKMCVFRIARKNDGFKEWTKANAGVNVVRFIIHRVCVLF